MYHSFSDIVAYASRSEPLKHGGVLGSGTLGGGSGAKIDRWVQPGDTVTLEVAGIGALSHKIGSH